MAVDRGVVEGCCPGTHHCAREDGTKLGCRRMSSSVPYLPLCDLRSGHGRRRVLGFTADARRFCGREPSMGR